VLASIRIERVRSVYRLQGEQTTIKLRKRKTNYESMAEKEGDKRDIRVEKSGGEERDEGARKAIYN
jgi:hypothetical protein